MTSEELRKALETGEEIEYHCMGVEHGADLLLPGPGWYPCRVDRIYTSGNVEIALTGEEDGLYVTVLNKNLSMAFRRRRQETVDWKAIEAQAKADLENIHTDKDAYAFIEKYLSADLRGRYSALYRSDRHEMNRTPRQAIESILSLPPIE